MKLRGALLVIAFVLVVSLQTVSLGYAASFSSSTTTATYLLHVLFAIYLSILAVQSVGKNTIGSHIRNVIHLPSLQHSRLRCWELPRFSLVIRHPFRHQLRTLDLTFASNLVCCTCSVRTLDCRLPSPLGPPLHFSRFTHLL